MKTIEALDIFGKTVRVPADAVIPRRSAYAIIVQNGKILLHHVKTTKLLWFPGGGVEADEEPQTSIPRELKEEVGIEVSVGAEYYRNAYDFLYNPSGKVYHCRNEYYLCRVIHGEVDERFQPDDGEAERPHWRTIASLRSGEFHPCVHELMQKLRQDFS